MALFWHISILSQQCVESYGGETRAPHPLCAYMDSYERWEDQQQDPSKERKKPIKSEKAQEGDTGVDVGYKDACRCTSIVFRPKQPKEHARYEIAS